MAKGTIRHIEPLLVQAPSYTETPPSGGFYICGNDTSESYVAGLAIISASSGSGAILLLED